MGRSLVVYSPARNSSSVPVVHDHGVLPNGSLRGSVSGENRFLVAANNCQWTVGALNLQLASSRRGLSRNLRRRSCLDSQTTPASNDRPGAAVGPQSLACDGCTGLEQIEAS